MITTLSMGEGNTPSKPQRTGTMTKAKVLAGPRRGAVVDVVDEMAGMTTAVFTDEKGKNHRFKAPSEHFQRVRAPRPDPSKKKSKKEKK